MSKKYLKILSLIIFIFLSILFCILKYNNNFNFLQNILSCPWTEIVLFFTKITGNYYIYGILITFLIVLLFIPTSKSVMQKIIKMGLDSPSYINILLYGKTKNKEDEEINIYMEKNFKRNYKRFFYYAKMKKISFWAIIIFFVLGFYFPFVMLGILQYPLEVNSSLNVSFLWIDDIFKNDPYQITSSLFAILIIAKNVFAITKSKTKKVVVIQVVLYVPLVVVSFSSVISAILGLEMLLTSVVKNKIKKIKEGKTNGTKKELIENSNK